MRALLDALAPWPLEEALGRPLVTLLLALLVPIATARLLALLLLPRDVATEPHARALQLAPFRSAAFLVGFVQLQLAWFTGRTALGPAWVASPASPYADAFAALTVLVAFVGGGIGRRVERERDAGPHSRVRDVVALRLRLGAYLMGPLCALQFAARFPVLDDAAQLRWGVLAGALLLITVGVAYGGLVSLVITGAVRGASERVRHLAHAAAKREGVRLWSVWRLPTGSVPFANAAAIPWARTMVVTDRITEILEDDELDAVLAHEAGHLSETPWVGLARVGAASLLIVALTFGSTILWALGFSDAEQILGLVLLAAVALVMLLGVRGLARRMEERADAHARRHVGAEPLARALEKLHQDARMPVVTGRKRVHPDLYDRLEACGRTQGPRPSAADARPGLVVGLGLVVALLVSMWLAYTLTDVSAYDAEVLTAEEAWRSLRVDPWDANATLALAWQSRRREDLDRADAYVAEAAYLGASPPALLEIEAELLAARGDCVAARETFDRALAARVVDPLESTLELGGYRIPPTLLTACEWGEATGMSVWPR